MKFERWFRIVAPYFVAGIGLDQFDLVTESAPIVKYMRGWTFHQVKLYCRRKRWMIEACR